MKKCECGGELEFNSRVYIFDDGDRRIIETYGDECYVESKSCDHSFKLEDAYECRKCGKFMVI